MLSSRYVHLHQALGLGPMWLNQAAQILPEDNQAIAPITVNAITKTHQGTSTPTHAAPVIQKGTNKAHGGAAAIREILHGKQTASSTINIALPDVPSKRMIDFTNIAWSDVQTQYNECQACQLHDSRRQAIWGTGQLPCDVLVISTSPTPNDDINNQLLSDVQILWGNMLQAMNIPNHAVFITPWVKCTAHQSLTTQQSERDACLPILQRQAEHAKLILFLGDQDYELQDHVAQWGKPYFQIPHPAKLLRQPALKAQVWQVFKALQAAL